MVKSLNVKLLVAIVGVMLLGLGLMVLLTRGPAPTEPLPELPVVEITPVVPQPAVPIYTLRVSLPKVTKLPVYQYSFASAPTSWARNLGFAGEPEEIEDALEGTLYLWSKEGQTLVINEDASSLSYRVDLNEPAVLSGSFLPSLEAAAEIVERTLAELGETLRLLEYDPTKNKALKTGVSLVQETILAEAELVEVHFVAKVGDYPIYLESGPEQDPVLAWIGRDGKLLRFDYSPLGKVGEKVGEYPLWSAEEVLAMLERGEGVVVSSTLEGGQTIASATVTRIAVGYLLPPPDATTLQPVFVVSAKVTTTGGKIGEVTIYLPAIKYD